MLRPSMRIVRGNYDSSPDAVHAGPQGNRSVFFAGKLGVGRAVRFVAQSQTNMAK
jgi:hypothetical protein